MGKIVYHHHFSFADRFEVELLDICNYDFRIPYFTQIAIIEELTKNNLLEFMYNRKEIKVNITSIKMFKKIKTYTGNF